MKNYNFSHFHDFTFIDIRIIIQKLKKKVVWSVSKKKRKEKTTKKKKRKKINNK